MHFQEISLGFSNKQATLADTLPPCLPVWGGIQGADPPPPPPSVTAVTAGRNNLNKEIIPLPLPPTGIGE
jgi:hypothetical protein